MNEVLDFIHSNICHNDLSKQNILVNSGKPVLIVFVLGVQLLVQSRMNSLGQKCLLLEGFSLTRFWCARKTTLFVGLGFTMATNMDGERVSNGMFTAMNAR